LSTGAGKRFGKKLYVIAAVVAVAVIAVALLVPPGTATIPLNVNYEVGEKMVYDTTMTLSYQGLDSALTSDLMGALNDMSVNAQQTIAVIDFDGEYYTLNQTTTMTMGGKPLSVSILQKMNKTGCSTYMFNAGGTEQEVSDTSFGNTYLTQLLSKSEVKVGDSIDVPFPGTVSSMGVTGGLTMTFKGIEDLTVPAGTYRVFRIDITSHDLSMSYNPSMTTAGMNLSSKMDMDVNFQMYMEYGTLRQVKSTMQETLSLQSSMMNYTMTLSLDMILSQHIKP
jgi:hypothetical protein